MSPMSHVYLRICKVLSLACGSLTSALKRGENDYCVIITSANFQSHSPEGAEPIEFVANYGSGLVDFVIVSFTSFLIIAISGSLWIGWSSVITSGESIKYSS